MIFMRRHFSKLGPLFPLLVFCYTFYFCSFAAAEERIDFVVDIDHILIDELLPEMGDVPKERIIVMPTASFRMADGAEEFLESLSRIPGAKISFYSNESKERNERILRSIRLKNGKSALSLAEGRLLNNVDVVVQGTIAQEYQFGPYRHFAGAKGGKKKDLSKISGLDLNRAFLIDDQRVVAAQGQEKNLLRLYNVDTDVAGRAESHDDLIRSLAESGEAKQARDVATARVQDRNRLAYARGMIEAAMEMSVREQISPIEALSRLQWEVGERGIVSIRPPDDIQFYRRGARLLKKINPDYHFTPALTGRVSDECSSVVVDLINLLKPKIHQPRTD